MLKPGRDRTDDVFRSMEFRVLSPELRVGKHNVQERPQTIAT